MGLIVWIVAMIIIMTALYVSDLIARDGYTMQRTFVQHASILGIFVSMFVLLWMLLVK